MRSLKQRFWVLNINFRRSAKSTFSYLDMVWPGKRSFIIAVKMRASEAVSLGRLLSTIAFKRIY